MRLLIPILVLLFAMPLVLASVAEVFAPIAVKVSDGDTVFLGTIGPGQTIDVVVNGAPTTGGNNNLGGRWDILKVVDTPQGWQGFDSKEMAVRMDAAVKAAPDAPDGTYKIKFTLMEYQNKQGLGSVTFYGTIVVSKDVLASSIAETTVETGVGQPARYTVVIENKGSASDVFQISSSGISGWDYKKTIHVSPGEKLTTFYEIVLNEEKQYSPTITVKSMSSDLLRDDFNVGLIIKSDIAGDIKATKNGVLVFPMILEPLYNLLGILGNLI